jgi:hypothetical protein
MTSLQHWTPDQWAVFGVTVAAGVAAAVLLYVARSAVLGWTAPAPLRRVEHTSTPRPSLVLTERRALASLPAAWEPGSIVSSAYLAAHTVPLPAWIDPMRVDFTDPGIGALSSIQAVSVDPTLRTSAELHAELDAWVNAYADLAPLMPETDAAAEQMRVNLEPVLRTARLWRVRGEGGPARQQLNDWRIDTPTGEYPMLTTADLAPYARALLAS